jgi:hypothetical protein
MYWVLGAGWRVEGCARCVSYRVGWIAMQRQGLATPRHPSMPRLYSPLVSWPLTFFYDKWWFQAQENIAPQIAPQTVRRLSKEVSAPISRLFSRARACVSAALRLNHHAYVHTHTHAHAHTHTHQPTNQHTNTHTPVMDLGFRGDAQTHTPLTDSGPVSPHHTDRSASWCRHRLMTSRST